MSNFSRAEAISIPVCSSILYEREELHELLHEVLSIQLSYFEVEDPEHLTEL